MAGILDRLGTCGAMILARVKRQIEKTKVALLSMIAMLGSRNAVALLNDACTPPSIC
ncbi:MAG: hypothetical protein JO122_08630 [Acetobacteraceae bacterium]|nr:hypothetical protein [Acetobacteraceae bacterium]